MLYEPPHFKHDERADALALIDAHPLATLVSVADGEPVVSHAPVQAQLRGEQVVLIGHLAKPNPQWRAWEAGTARVTAIFHGPNSYISPAWYEVPEAVPTWNYMVVHAEGVATTQHDSDIKEAVLKRLIDAHDPPYHAHWNDALSADYRERMKRGIVAFEVHVERLRVKFKLSQNRSPFDKASVLAHMERAEAPRAADRRELGAWMRRLGIGA